MKSIFLHYIDTIADNIFKNENKTFINVSFFSFVVITMYKLINNKKMYNTFTEFFTQKSSIINIIIISSFCFLIYRFQKNNDDNNETAQNASDSAKKAIAAMFIALFAKLDMVIAPFWFIWLLSFYMNIV